MGIIAGLALAGSAFQTIGAIQANKEQRKLSKLQRKEIDFQARTSANLFDILFPNQVEQQQAQRGQLATSIAKSGVDVGSGSALAQISEQARIDKTNEQLAQYQQELDQRGFEFDKRLNRRTEKNLKREGRLTVASGLLGAGNAFARVGGFS